MSRAIIWSVHHRALILLLVAASLLRLALVAQGGQLYWPDERLYTQVLDIFDLNQSSWFGVVKALVGTQDHLGFALISAGPAGLQLALSHALSRSGNALTIVPGVVLSQISVAAIALVYAIARRAGRDRVEALIAAALMASATTMFYYARHLLPYDSSMALALLALWCGLGTTRRDSLSCGAAASAAFIAYNGYWLLASGVILVHVFHEGRAPMRLAFERAVFAGVGVLLVPIVIMAVQVATGAPLLFSGMQRLAGTVTDGYAPEGFSVTWAYLWHAEHGLLLVWLVAALLVVFDTGEWNPRRRHTATVWIVSAVFVYLGLAFTAALALQVAWNFRQPLQQRFPRDVIAEITAKYGPVDRDMTLEGPPLINPHEPSRWVLLNAQHLYHPRAPRPPLPSGILEVMRFPHPLQFVPYQYEGFDPMERQVLRNADIAMRLIDIGMPVDPLP